MSDYRTLKLALLADTSKFGSNLNKAQNQTKTFGQKVGDTAKKIGKAFAVAGVAIAGMAAKLAIDGVKAAIEDQKAQVKLATTLKNTTKASNAQIKSVEKYIDKLQRASGVADDKLRPSLEKLLVATGKVGKAQKLQALAMDIAAGTSRDLDSVSLALARAYNGNLGALTRLGIKLDESIIKNKDFDAAQKELNKTFTGQSAAAADTMEGKFKRFNIAISEAKESIGVAMMPALEDMVNYLNSPKGQKVITNFAEAFADAIKLMAQYLPGVVKHVSKLVSKVSKQGLMAGLLSDPKIAVAAAAYGAGFIAGGPAGGAVAAIAAYAGVKSLESYGENVSGDLSGAAALLSGNALGQLQAGGGGQKKKDKLFPGRPGSFWSNRKDAAGDLAAYEAGDSYTKGDWKSGGGGAFDKPKMLMPSDRLAPTINIVINGAADSRESARAIERTLKKLQFNGGSLKGIEGFN